MESNSNPVDCVHNADKENSNVGIAYGSCDGKKITTEEEYELALNLRERFILHFMNTHFLCSERLGHMYETLNKRIEEYESSLSPLPLEDKTKE